jgi:hypothetical protein
MLALPLRSNMGYLSTASLKPYCCCNCCRLGWRRLVGRGIEADPEGAFHDFMAGAQRGDAYALFNLGYMYLRGLYVKQNYSEAHSYFEKSAKGGLAAGYNGLGVLQVRGVARRACWQGCCGTCSNRLCVRPALAGGVCRFWRC